MPKEKENLEDSKIMDILAGQIQGPSRIEPLWAR